MVAPPSNVEVIRIKGRGVEAIQTDVPESVTQFDAAEIEATLHEVRAFKMMSILRVLGEVMITLLDPDYFVSPQEYAIGMKEYFPDEEPRLAGLIDMLRPQFDRDWARYGANYL